MSPGTKPKPLSTIKEALLWVEGDNGRDIDKSGARSPSMEWRVVLVSERRVFYGCSFLEAVNRARGAL